MKKRNFIPPLKKILSPRALIFRDQICYVAYRTFSAPESLLEFSALAECWDLAGICHFSASPLVAQREGSIQAWIFHHKNGQLYAIKKSLKDDWLVLWSVKVELGSLFMIFFSFIVALWLIDWLNSFCFLWLRYPYATYLRYLYRFSNEIAPDPSDF